jgi:copper chaperone CopZ
MQTCVFDLPAMYGDHHVTEVRRILLAVTGITDVYASSSFQVVEVTYDPAQIAVEAIIQRLTEAGYMGNMTLPLETGQASERTAYFRHTASYHQTGQTIGFGQTVNLAERALWPCPGLGTITQEE